MKIIHRVGINPDDYQRRTLRELGIELPTSDNPYTSAVTLELEEQSEEYKKLKPYIESWQLFDAVGTIFSTEDLESAKLLGFRDCWANGYPMPDNNGGYKEITYDRADYCKECGIGLVQKAPFRLKKEPNWGKKKMFMLNWVYDEIFVKKDLYEEVFKKYGMETMPVLLYKKETIIADTVQLLIPATDISLKLESYSYEVCNVCNRKRYNLINKGKFPFFEQEITDRHFFKSKEYFGTGANARKYIFLSSEIRTELLEQKVKANYIPVTV